MNFNNLHLKHIIAYHLKSNFVNLDYILFFGTLEQFLTSVIIHPRCFYLSVNPWKIFPTTLN
ncbi:hypothetical protein GAMM_40168 [Gammaproteobacteria bacterium]